MPIFFFFFRTKLVSIPFPTRRATFNEVKRVHEHLMTIETHKESVEEMKNKLISNEDRKTNRPMIKSPKNKNIRRSKSRETPKRELPDFVQALANEAASQSEDEGEIDLQKYDFTKKPKKSAKTPSPTKKDRTVELQNGLVTAVKTNDTKLFEILYESDEVKVKMQINETFGDSKFTLLHIAAREGHAKMVLKLLELGADPTAKDKVKKTPYSYCPDKPSRTAFRRFQVIVFCLSVVLKTV